MTLPLTSASARRVAFLFLLAPLFMALNLVIARSLRGSVPPLTLATARWAVAAALITPFVDLSPLRAIGAGERRTLALLALFGGALTVGPQYVATGLTSAGHVGLAFALTPLLVSLLQWLVWRKRSDARLAIGALTALVGVALVSLRVTPGRGLTIGVGDVLALAGATGWAGYTCVLRHRPLSISPLLLLWCVAAGGALMLVPVAALEWRGAAPPTLSIRLIADVVGLALVSSIAVYLTFGALVRLAGAPAASMSMFIVPIYAMIAGALLLRDALDLRDGAALLLITVGVAISIRLPTIGRWRLSSSRLDAQNAGSMNKRPILGKP